MHVTSGLLRLLDLTDIEKVLLPHLLLLLLMSLMSLMSLIQVHACGALPDANRLFYLSNIQNTAW